MCVCVRACMCVCVCVCVCGSRENQMKPVGRKGEGSRLSKEDVCVHILCECTQHTPTHTLYRLKRTLIQVGREGLALCATLTTRFRRTCRA